jgi:hypothetical protein
MIEQFLQVIRSVFFRRFSPFGSVANVDPIIETVISLRKRHRLHLNLRLVCVQIKHNTGKLVSSIDLYSQIIFEVAVYQSLNFVLIAYLLLLFVVIRNNTLSLLFVTCFRIQLVNCTKKNRKRLIINGEYESYVRWWRIS